MFRSPRHAGLALVLAGALAAGAAGPVQSAAQGPPETAEARDLTLPVLDLELETSSLDGSLRRVDRPEDVRVTLAADVLFEFNRARLTSRAVRRIEHVADEIRRAGPAAVTVEGHTDSRGSDSYNLALSRRRAQSVRSALLRALGEGAPRIVAAGRGESRPAAANTQRDGSDNPRGRARNRRVEIRIPKA